MRTLKILTFIMSHCLNLIHTACKKKGEFR